VFKEVIGLTLPRNSQANEPGREKVDKTELQPAIWCSSIPADGRFHTSYLHREERFVHAPRRGRDVEVSSMHSRYWNKRYNGARRVSF